MKTKEIRQSGGLSGQVKLLEITEPDTDNSDYKFCIEYKINSFIGKSYTKDIISACHAFNTIAQTLSVPVFIKDK